MGININAELQRIEDEIRNNPKTACEVCGKEYCYMFITGETKCADCAVVKEIEEESHHDTRSNTGTW